MASLNFRRALLGALPSIVTLAGVALLANQPAPAQTEAAQSSNWVNEPGSNRFGVGLNGLGGTHATPMFASSTDITGWGITDMKTRTPSAPLPAEVMPGAGTRSIEAGGNDLGGLLPPLDQR
ncbi:MAG TPA: hypothetical protein VKV32_17020 [Stellaceae bacterium]|nr:hypothetical protein [Stellaceae bacterium]